MILVDANLLIYAYDSSSELHPGASRWLADVMGGVEPLGLPTQSLLAFVRLSSNSSLFRRPLTSAKAVEIVREWLDRPHVSCPVPGDRHWQIVGALAKAAQVRGPGMMDAHLAALTVEHGATLYTTDRGFARFPKLRFQNPIAG